MPSIRCKPGDAPDIPLTRPAAKLAAPILHKNFQANHPDGVNQLSPERKLQVVAEVNAALTAGGFPAHYTRPKLECWISNQLYRWRAAAKKGAKAPAPALKALQERQDKGTDTNLRTPTGVKASSPSTPNHLAVDDNSVWSSWTFDTSTSCKETTDLSKASPVVETAGTPPGSSFSPKKPTETKRSRVAEDNLPRRVRQRASSQVVPQESALSPRCTQAPSSETLCRSSSDLGSMMTTINPDISSIELPSFPNVFDYDGKDAAMHDAMRAAMGDQITGMSALDTVFTSVLSPRPGAEIFGCRPAELDNSKSICGGNQYCAASLIKQSPSQNFERSSSQLSIDFLVNEPETLPTCIF